MNVAKEKHPLINIDETLRRKNQKKGKKISIIHDKFLVQTTDESCITKKRSLCYTKFCMIENVIKYAVHFVEN